MDDIRSELVKLLRTLNNTNAGILGAEHELKQKVCRVVRRFVGWSRETPFLSCYIEGAPREEGGGEAEGSTRVVEDGRRHGRARADPRSVLSARSGSLEQSVVRR